MGRHHLWLFHLVAILLTTCSLAALPERNCSTSLILRASGNCTYADGLVGVCNSLSVYLEQCNGVVAASDCLNVSLYGGDYTLTDYTTKLEYSLVMRAVEGPVIVSCPHQKQDDTLTSGSPFWFSRDAGNSDGEFFVQVEGINFQRCQRPLQFDALDYVGISRCNFSEFNSSAVDIFNCQNIQVESSVFRNNSAVLKKDKYRSNSGGLGIAYHTNDTVYFNASNPPWILVSNCIFEANLVTLPGANSQQQINQALNNHFYFGRGGGFGIFLDEFFIDITVDIQQCSFRDNFAESFGGGLYIYIDGNSTHHKFTVSDCNFTGNYAGEDSFGGGLQVAFLIRNARSRPSQLDFIRCRFIGNNASFGGGISAVQVYSQGSGNIISLRDSHFEENAASSVGSAVMFASLLYVQNRQSSYFYQVSDNVFFNNESPGGTFSTGFIPQNFTGHNQFRNNTGPGLRSVGSQIAMRGNLSFIGNNAEGYEGGAIYISAFGQLKLYRGTYIDFIENVGRVGSAIVVDVQRSSQVFSELIFNTQCFFIFENTTTAPDQWDQVTVHFSGNRAAVGPVVYTSHLSLCSWFSVTSTSNTSNHIQATFSIANFTEWPVFYYEDNVAVAHSYNSHNPSFYFQTEATKVSAQTNQTMAVYPGQRVRLELIGRDQFRQPTYFIARVSDSRADINSGAFSQTKEDDIINNNMNAKDFVTFEPALIPITPNEPLPIVLYRVPRSETREGGNITVVVDTPYNVIDSEQFVFTLTTAPCLPGYELSPRVEGDDLLTCTCKDSTFFILACSERDNAIFLRDGLWARSVETPDPHLEVNVCPTPFCQCSDENGIMCDSLYYHDDPDSNKQCHPLREGTLCGRCVNGTGVGVLRFNCRDCDSDNYWALGFLVVGDALVCVAILIALVKLSYTFPHSMKGLLFYIQTVYYTTAYFPASFWSARQYMLYLGSGLGLYFPWDFCLSREMTALASFPPRFVPPTIATLVAVSAIVSVFYCFEKRAQKRIWHGVWAFILLLYAPLVHTCLSLLNCPSIPPAQGGPPSPRWFLDGEVACFRDGGHTALGVIAILVLSLLCFLPPAIFFFTVFTHSSQSVKTKNPLVERLYSAVSAGYEERARWWGAWDLFRRLFLIAAIIIFPGRSVSALYILVPALALHLYIWPYLHWWQNILEALILTNYCLLHLLRSTQTILDDLTDTSYSGTAVPMSRGRGLANYDRLAQLFSFWYYWPLAMGATTVLLIVMRALVKCVRLRRTSGGSKSEAVVGVGYHRYTAGSKAVTVTDVSIS